MHRFFTSPENISADGVTLRGADVAHIRTVLRLKSGDRVQVLDGQGSLYSVVLIKVKPKEVTGRIVSREEVPVEPALNIRMGQALIKGNQFDGILRKSVELGVSSVVPLKPRRCIVKIPRAEETKKNNRWKKIAQSAARQCGRSSIPKVESRIQSVEEFCRDSADYDLKLIFWEEEGEIRLKDLDPPNPPRSIAFLIGPEGGFCSEEVQAANRYGFKTVGLGQRILRAETAPVVALSLLQNLWGDL